MRSFVSAIIVATALVLAVPAVPALPARAHSDAPAKARQTYLVAFPYTTVALYDSPGGRVIGSTTKLTDFGQAKAWAVTRRRGRWLAVLDPMGHNRPVWIRASRRIGFRYIHIVMIADLSQKTLTVFREGEPIRTVRVAIGAPDTPTPLGRFAVTDRLHNSRFNPIYGCCVLALSGHQTHTPAGWPGGDRLAIHGTDASSTIGQAASYGCLRASDANLRFLMRRVPIGTSVFIRP